jgi:hypothetical protein
MVGTDLDPSLTADEAGQLEMMQILLVGSGAGAAAALLFASIASGSVLAFFLLYLSPLPIMIAALGWTHWAGLVAAFTAAAALGSLFGFVFFAAFLLGLAMPAWWLAYLALLARPSQSPSGVEWYPIGRIVLWAALLGAAIASVGALLLIGADQEALRTAFRKALDEFVRGQILAPAAGGTLSAEQRERLLDMLLVLLPPAAAMSFLVLNCVNLWLAGRVVRVSGRLPRPWPNVSDLSLPLVAPVLLAVSVAGTFAPDFLGAANLIGTICSCLAAPLLMAHLMVGFAVIHAVTAGINARVLILAGMYAAFLILSPRTSLVVFALAALGLAETLFGIRGRVAARRLPPGQHT